MNNSSRLYFIVALLFTSILSTNSTIAQNTLNLAGLSASSPSKVAYSLRRLSSTYSGNLIQVRRSSDNTTAEIGYDGSGHLDTNALKTFVGAGNGFVSIWYDQSGNANDAEQSTNGSQPQIVSAGVVLRSNSRPTVRFDGNTFIDGGSSAYSITNARTLNAVYNLQSGAASHIIDRNVAGTPVYSIKGDNQGQIRNDASTIINEGTSQSAPFTNTFTMIWDGSNNINIFKNAVSNYSGSLSLPCTMDIMRIGRHYNNTGTYELNMWEVVLFPSAISSGDRLAMECNQQLYYNLPAPTVTSVTPLLGFPASSVSIVGTNFDAATSNNIVYFGATQAAVTSATTTTLNVTVPTGATYAPLTVLTTRCGLSVRSAKPYLPYYNNAAYVPATTNFKTRFTKSAGSTPMYLALGDMDGDGKTDIVTSNEGANTVNVLRNVSSGGTMSSSSFSTEVGFTTGNSPRFIRLGDIDGDGKLDIVVSNGTSSSISVFRNTSSIGSINTGSFAAKVDFTLAGVPANIAIADLDGDGRLDISVCNNGTTISVFKNTSSPGSISLATRADFTAGNSNVGLTAADLDGDGKIDLACSNNFASSASGITVLRNTTSGTISFASGVTFAGPWSEIDVITLDIDGDGKLDLAAVGQNGLTVWQNTATSGVINSGSFASRVDYPGLANTRTIASGDFDGDGRPDLVTTYYLADDTRVYRNLTTGSGSTITTSSFASYIAFPNVNQTGLAVGDLDGDGKADIVTGHNLISVLQNDPLQPITGTAQVCAGNTTTLANATTGGTWSSSNAAIATVGASSGVVTGVSGGTVTITYAGTAGASFAGNRVTTVVTVHPTPSTFTGSAVLSTSITTTLSNAIAGGTWSSSNVGVATIGSSTGVVTGVAAGTSIITYTTAQSCVSTTIVTVNTPANALHFNGSDDVVTIPNNAALNISSNITIEAWINVSSTVNASQNVICKSNNINNNGYIFPRTDNNWLSVFAYLHIAGNWEILTAPYPTPAVGTWHHCALTYDGSQVTIYVDGQIGNTLAVSGPLTVNNNALTMGNQVGYSEYFTGSLDEARIWNIARTQAQIQADMNRDIAQNANLVAYYKFNEGTATGTNTGLTNLTDFSGNANCGTLSGFALSGSTSNYVVGAIGNSNTLNVVSPITGTLAVCQSQTTTLNSTTPSGVWSSSNTGVATVAAGVVTGVAAGTATISYEKCGVTVTVVVTVNALPSVSAGSGVAICTGSSTGLTATGAATYSWSPATNLSATTGATVTANPTSTITYTVTGTNANGCSNTSSVTVTVNALPPVSAGPDLAICTTYSTSITATGAVDYTWSPATNLSATTGATVTANPTSMITYTVTGTDGNGCVNTAQKTVSVNPLPGVISSSTTNCIGTTTTISSSPSGGTWSSSNTGVATIGLNSGILNNVSTGTSNITYQLPVTGCYRVSEVTVNPFPAAISIPSALCPTQTATLTSASSGGTWSSTNASVMSVNSTTGEITAVINNYSGVSYTFIYYTLPTGCAVSRMVTVNPVPAPIFGGTSALCLGESTTLTSGSSGLNWSSSTPAVATVSGGGVVNSVGAGTTIISYTNGSSCATTKVVTVNGALPANTGTLSVCTGQTTTMSNATPSGTWSSSNNTVASVNTLTGVVSGLSGGTVNISYRIGSTCFSVSQVTVNSNVAAVGGTKTVCVGTTTTLTYPVSGGTWSSATPAVATIDLNSGLVTGIGLGTSEITYTVAAGCFKTAVVTVTALPASITGTAVVCQGSTTTLSNGSGTWSSSNSGIATVNSSGVVSGVSAGNANITFRATATGCYVTREVTVNPLPVLGLAAVCPVQTATLTATPSGGTWSISNPSTATVNTTTGELTGVIVNNTGISLAVVTYTSTSACVKTGVITVNPVPSVITGGVRSICISATTTLSSSTAGGVWSSSNTGVATISPARLVTGIGTGTSTISYTNGSGCTTTTEMTVSALPVATAITGTLTVCKLATTSLSNATPGGTWSSSNVYTAIVNSSGVVTGNNAGTVRITYTLGSGCTAFSTAIVTVNHIPAVTAITGTLSVCENATRTLSSISTGGVWSSSVPAVGSIGVTGIVTGITAGNTTISYTVSNGFGCVGRSTAEVTVNPVPVVDTITGTLSVCKDATTTLSSVTGGGVWTSSTPAVGTVGLTGIVTGVNAGTTIISYTVTNGFGCVTRVTKVVTVNPLPVINSLSGIFTTCENVNLLLNSNIPFGTWSSSNVSVGTIDTFAGVLVPASVGTTIVTYNVLSTGCSSTIEVTTIQAPAVIAGVTALCPGGTATLTTTPAGGIWTTSNSSVLTVNSATGEVAAVMVGYGGISVAGITYTIPNGCFRTVAPTVNPIPSPIYGGVTSICLGESTTFLSGSVGLTWSSSATGVATVSSGGVVTAQGAGVATISYTNSFGCANTRAVTVNAALSPNVGSSSICTGTTTTFTNAITGGTWTSSNVSKATINLTTGLVTATNAGTTTLSYRVPSGCYVTNTITVNTTPAEIAGTRSVCIGSTTTLSTTPLGGVWSSSNNLLATVGSSSGIVSGVSNGTVTVTYASTAGCTKTAEVTVNTLPASITGAGVACASGGTTALTNVSGTWTSSNTSIASVSYLGMVTGGSAGTAIITFRNLNNCATTKEVTINPLPATLVSPTGLCAGSTTTLTGSPSGGTWLSSNPSVFTVNTITGELTAVIVNITSNSLAVVTYTLPTGCSRTGLITINKQPSPIYGGTGKVCTGGTLAQYSGSSGYTWSSATPSVATISPTGVVTGVTAGNTVISYTSAAGCAAQRVITVNATPDVITGATTVLVGQTTTLANATMGGTWSSSATSKATIGSASGVVTGMSTGTSNITYMMPTGCYVTRPINVAAARGVSEQVAEHIVSEVSIYPNPTTGIFSISTTVGGTIRVYTIDGKELLQQKVGSGVSSITLPYNIVAGFYTCMFTSADGGTTIMRLVYEPK